MPQPPYQGVILAAGQGQRMGPLSEHYPKALLPVVNVPLIVRHVKTLHELGVRETFIVVGHLGNRIREALGDGTAHGMALHYVDQGPRQGIAHAVAALESRLSGSFILLLGDIYFDLHDPQQAITLMAQHNADVVLAVKTEIDADAVRRNFSVEMDDAGRVYRVVEKPVEPASLCKGCGLYLFTPALFDAIRRTPQSPLRDEYELTDAIQILIDDGSPVYGAAVVDWDVNVTTPSDLIDCSRHGLESMGIPHLVGQNTSVPAGTTLVETVLGDNVVIARPCHLERCVVLPGTVLDTTEPLYDQVRYPVA